MDAGNTNFKEINLSDYFQLNSQKELFNEENPLKLIDLFETSMNSENPHYSENREFLIPFIKKFKNLTSNNSDSSINERIIIIYGRLYYSVFDDNNFIDKLNKHSLKIINIENVYNYLKIATNTKNGGLVSLCLEFLEKVILKKDADHSLLNYTSGKLHLNVHPSELLISFDELNEHTTKLQKILNCNIRITLITDHFSDNMQGFLDEHGGNIDKLDLQNPDDELLKKIIVYTTNLRQIDIHDSAMTDVSLETMSTIKTLAYLNLYNCNNFEYLNFLPSNLKSIELHGCKKLITINEFPNKLTCIIIKECPKLDLIPTLTLKLNHICISECPLLHQNTLLKILSSLFDLNAELAFKNWFKFEIDIEILGQLFIRKIGFKNLSSEFTKYYDKLKNGTSLNTLAKFLQQIIAEIIQSKFDKELKTKLINEIQVCLFQYISDTNVYDILKFAKEHRLVFTLHRCIEMLNKNIDDDYHSEYLYLNDELKLCMYLDWDLLKNYENTKKIIEQYKLAWGPDFEISLKIEELKNLNTLLITYGKLVSTIELLFYNQSDFENFIHFPNCTALKIIDEQLKEADFNSLKKLNKLENLSLFNYIGAKSDFQLPPNLTSLFLENCSNMVGLPQLPLTITRLSVKNCIKICDDNKLKALTQISDKDKSLWFNSCVDVNILNNKDLILLIFKKLSLEEIVIQLKDIINRDAIENIYIKLIIDIINNFIKINFNFFFNNHPNIFPSPSQYYNYRPLIKGEKWDKVKALKPDRIKLTLPQLETIKDFEDIPEIEITKLFEIFDKFNFTDPTRKDFIHPDTIKYRGKSVTTDELRAGLFKIIEHTINNLPYSAVPSDENERFKWYRQLEYALKLFIQLSSNSTDTFTIFQRLKNLACSAATELCGTVWRNEAHEAIDVLQENIEIKQQDFVSKISQFFDELKINALYNIPKEILNRGLNTVANEVHIFNGIAIKMREMGFNLPHISSIDFKDPWTPIWANYRSYNVEYHIISYFNFINASLFILNRFKDELKSNPSFSNDLVENFHVYAESQLKTEMAVIDKSLKEKQKQFGLKKAVAFVTIKQMDIAIINDDGEAAVFFKQSKNRILFLQRTQALAGCLKRKSHKPKQIMVLSESNIPNDKNPKIDHEILKLNEHNEKVDQKINNIRKKIAKYQNYINLPENHLKDIERLADPESVSDAILNEKILAFQQYLTNNGLLTFKDNGDIEVTLAGVLELLKHLKFLS
jgi:hypothetical protein